jgi:hypothetical protein
VWQARVLNPVCIARVAMQGLRLLQHKLISFATGAI